MNEESSVTVSQSVRCRAPTAPTANEPFGFKVEKMLPVVDSTSTENCGGEKYRWAEKAAR